MSGGGHQVGWPSEKRRKLRRILAPTAQFVGGERTRRRRLGSQFVGGVLAAVCGSLLPEAWGDWSTVAWLIVGLAAGIGGPMWLTETKLNPSRDMDLELAAFADKLPQAVSKIIRFMQSERSDEDASILRNDLAEATSAMVSGTRPGRVCVWRLDRREGESEPKNRYLAYDCAGGRSERPRDDFQPHQLHGQAHIEAALEGKQVPVQDIHRPPKELLYIDTSKVGRYGSFILTPIRRNGVTWGTVTIDYVGKNHLTQVDGAVSSAIARLFETGFAYIRQGGADVTLSEREQLLFEVGRDGMLGGGGEDGERS